MAFPVIESAAESSTNSAGTTHTINYPSGIAAGDTLLLILGKGSTAATMNAVADWTEIIDENAARGGFIAWKKAAGTESGTIAFTSSASTKSARIMYRISGATDPTVRAPEISTVATGTSNAPNPTTCTPTGGAKDYLWVTFFILGGSGEEADDDTWCNNAATNYGSLLQKTSGTAGTNIGAYIAASNRTNNAASEDAIWPAATTDVSLAWRAWTIAVHPAPTALAIDANPPAGGFVQTGVTASTIADRLLAGGAVTASYAQAGVSATLERGKFVSADPGAYTQTGVAASTAAGRSLADGAATGSYALSGVAATFSVGKFVDASPGAYSSTGIDATFAIDVAEVFINADPGSFAGTGVAATLAIDRALADGAVSGSYAGTGVATSLVAERGLAGGALPGAHAWSGVAASLTVERFISVDPGAYASTGVSATFATSRALSADPGAYGLTGVAAGLVALKDKKAKNAKIHLGLGLRLG